MSQEEKYLDEEEEEMKKVNEENERELRLGAIKKLAEKLNWSTDKLGASVMRKYDKTLKALSIEELDEVLRSLKKKVGEKMLEKKKEEGYEVELEPKVEAKITFEDTETDALFCHSNGNKYEISKSAKICSCDGFKQWGHCKHLDAALKEGYIELKIETIEPAPTGKEEEYKILVGEDKQVVVQVKTIEKAITSELTATKMLKNILGEHPNRNDVIESYQDVEEIAADVIISLAQYAGIRFYPVSREVEKAKINLGKVYQATTGDKKFDSVVEMMPETDVTIRCKITVVAAWKDKSGNLRIGTGTKEEHMTPYELKDIAKRGANFIETKCESKAFKKAIINALPITHDGLLSKIKHVYGWS